MVLPQAGVGQKLAGTLPSDFKPAECAVLKLTFGVSGTAANTDEGAEPFLADARPHIQHCRYWFYCPCTSNLYLHFELCTCILNLHFAIFACA